MFSYQSFSTKSFSTKSFSFDLVEEQAKSGKRSLSKRRQKILDKQEEYKIGLDSYLSDAPLDYETITEVIDGVEVVSDKPVEPLISISASAPELKAIVDPVDKEIAKLMRSKEEYIHSVQMFKYAEETKKMDEELFFMVIALTEEDF